MTDSPRMHVPEFINETGPPPRFTRAWPPGVERGVAHARLPLYEATGHLSGCLPPLPLPVDDAGLFCGRDSDGPGVPAFDPARHLDLHAPDYVECLPSFARVREVPAVSSNAGSRLAFTAPFQFLSAAGVAALRSVLDNHEAKRNHRSFQHRGLYHFSPFVRSLCSDPSLMRFLARLTGEPVMPHQLLMDAAFANESRMNEDAAVAGCGDPWHFDSCTYVAVTLLSEPMDGGDLQVIRRCRDEALHRIAETGNRLREPEIATVDYQTPGRCILLQGSEVVHRVTPVLSASGPRIAFGLGLQPASPFRWDKTNFDSFARYDGLESAGYEFYRQKAHALGHALTELARQAPSSARKADLAAQLRAVAAELDRVADLVQTEALPAVDFVGFVDESKLRLTLRAAL